VARSQLRRRDTMCEARREYAEGYDRALQDVERRGLLRRPAGGRSRIWYRYAIEVAQGRAAELSVLMRSQDVDTAQPVDDWHRGATTAWPRSAHAYESLLSLPLYPTLRAEERNRTIEALLFAAKRLL
jgi:dTDP-4-amino-4,6-dideoxygalactose transaminase